MANDGKLPVNLIKNLPNNNVPIVSLPPLLDDRRLLLLVLGELLPKNRFYGIFVFRMRLSEMI